MSDEALNERLYQENPQFRRLKEDHRTHDAALATLHKLLHAKGFLFPDQQQRVSELKKRKLLAKDKMEAIRRRAMRQTRDAVPA